MRGGATGSRDAPPLIRPQAGGELPDRMQRSPIAAILARRKKIPIRPQCHAIAESFRFRSSGQVSSKRLETLADFARHKYLLRIECECGRVKLADPHKMIAACQARRISYRLDAVAARLRCENCGQRPWRVGPGLGG